MKRRSPSRRHAKELTIALCVPLGGAAGLWGPAALASARLAVAELNASSGIAGRFCRLVTINAGDDAHEIEASLIELVEAEEVDALVGMHTSAVRHDLLNAIGGSIPFVYTPLYEGGERTPGVFAIGETTVNQLRLAIHWLGEHRHPRRWMFVGNDYVWPHVTHRLAHRFVGESGASVVREMYLPFGGGDYGYVLDQIRAQKADAVLLSLIGQDAIDFNRAFGAAGLAGRVVRLSCALGENELLGIGAQHTDDLYVASGYFASLNTDANLSFKERYHSHFGARAPTLDTFGQSTYEGVHFLAALLDDARRRNPADEGGLARLGTAPLAYRSARGAAYAGGRVNRVPIYLARAAGHQFEVITPI
ncbi:substrate-binding domain-containing protein [Paraburkholderia megapolitana]|uniref:Amino acid/amide ABC transporter substrate-binding protein, HAAT family n=1 Tax=Paraburkholderia megapolitana TaxID=420953 RepID=A0A1I3NXI2_9BURK|nr:substrate-binding domain-containing protein [Paraburkholderia megapolitana]SFJ13929.1 amino acid/amide ABC transporter substrate-binding protein, HAAT family [Paraburkholderia megapolitana]